MKPQPPTLSLKPGTPVLYYAGTEPLSLFLGGKIGGSRILSNSAARLGSGLCVRADKFPQAVFPAPKEEGKSVFDSSVCTRLGLSLDPRFKVEIRYVQCGPSTWCAAVSEMVVGDHGRYSPVSIEHSHPSLESALAHLLPALLLELRELATGSEVLLRQRHGLPKSLCGKARRFGKNAIYSIIAAIPKHIASDILKSLNGAR